jgi:penicillin amidase
MSRTARRFLTGSLGLILVLVIVLPAGGVYTARRSFPKTDGELSLSGLDAPVDVYRDKYGIPHIYASTTHDLFFAQGYVHAQDRFWQMDFWRHIGSGRLSEMFGDSQVDTDKFLRTLGWGRVAQQELGALDPQSLAILDAYAQGVNAYLADHHGSQLSLEYAVLKLLNPGYQVEPWQPLHSLTWAKAMAWDLRGNIDEEIERAILLKTLTPEQLAELYPPYPADHPVIVPHTQQPSPLASLPSRYSAPLYPLTPLPALFTPLLPQINALDTLLGPSGSGIGSNSWVVSGVRTSTGKPLLANDPHLSAQMPSIWYEIGLHCEPKGEACPWEVAGFSFAGAPGVILGHNQRIAWGFTNLNPDVMDLYIEKLNPANPDQYEVNGGWVDMTKVQETIQVAGGQPVELTVRYTRHGPVISETYGKLEDFRDTAGIELPPSYAVALRWTALEISHTFPAIWMLDQAGNWDEFRHALSFFDVPSQNVIYADIDGNIGYQSPGKIPLRASGDGRLPVPGWTDEYEWTGFIPFDELPRSFNPPEGYVVTANNAVVGPDYPYFITTDWDYGYRARRIVDMIESHPGPIDLAWMQSMQGDDLTPNAGVLVPLILQAHWSKPIYAQAFEMLTKWDGQSRMDSAGAAIFAAFWKNLLALAFHDDLPEAYYPSGNDRWIEVVRDLSEQPDSPWWDDATTKDKVENRDDILLGAFIAAVDELEKALGKDPSKWAWGDLHTLTLRNQTLGESGVKPIEALFNRGPYRTAGGESIVNATGWDPNAADPYAVNWLPSERMVVDLSDLTNSTTIHTTGQSGHAYHSHYADMTDLWRTIQSHAMLWERTRIEAEAEGHLRLVP